MPHNQDNDMQTAILHTGKYTKYDNTQEDTTVGKDFDPSIIDYRNYLKEENLEQSKYSDLLKEFELTKVDLNEVKYADYLQYLIDTKRIQHDRELYSHIVKSLDYFVSNNMLHIDKQHTYVGNLNKTLYSANEEYVPDDIKSKYTQVDYALYKNSNDDCRNVSNNQLLNELFQRGGEIYSNSRNKFYLKWSKEDKLDEYTKKDTEAILTKIFKFKVKITDDAIEYKDIDMEDFRFDSSYEVISTKLIGDDDV